MAKPNQAGYILIDNKELESSLLLQAGYFTNQIKQTKK